jgi:hypothetical protein
LNTTAGTCLLAALLAVGTACGGGDGERQVRSGGTTFRGGGFSFTYPGKWRQRSAGPAEVSGVLYETKVGPKGRPHDLVSVQVTEVGIKIEGENLSITEDNIDENAELLSIAADFMTTAAGGKLGKRERATVGGLPGFRWRASHLTMQGGARVDARLTHLFNGPKGYLVTCLYTREAAAEVKRACEQALSSFRLTSAD